MHLIPWLLSLCLTLCFIARLNVYPIKYHPVDRTIRIVAGYQTCYKRSRESRALQINNVSILSELDDGAYNPLWTMRGFTQTFHFWKETKRAQSVPLNAFLTYITLPWWSIAKGKPKRNHIVWIFLFFNIWTQFFKIIWPYYVVI